MANKAPRMFGDQTPPDTNAEMKRILWMSGVLVVLLVIFVVNLPGGAEDPRPDLPMGVTEGGPTAPRVKVPELDVAALAALVADSTEDARSTLEADARELLFEHAAKLVDRHFEAMDTPALDEALVAEILGDPDASRGRPLRLRGYLLDMVQRTRADGEPFHQGSMVLDDGVIVHVAADDLQTDKLGPGSAVRLDGFFMKVLVEEAGGGWIDAPLVVGHELVRSFPALYTELPNARVEDGGTYTESELANIVNDDIREGVGTLPFAEKWKLLGRAALAAEDGVDWDATPVLDRQTLQALLDDPDPWRGMPVRLPLDGAALLTVTNRPAGENPARLERYADGWLAEYSWYDFVPTIQFLAPFDVDIDTAEDPTVVGRGFFFKNLAYQADEAGTRLTPILVLSSLDEVGRSGSGSVPTLMAIVAGGAILFGAILFLLVRRDKQQSEAFAARRKQRQRRREGAGASAG